VKGAKRLGMRIGNWLTPTQGKELLGMPDRDSVKGKRNYAMLAVLLGCGLRRAELTRLTVNHLQQRDNHWAIIDLFGKGGHVRTVPVPEWVKVAMDSWLAVACIETGLSSGASAELATFGVAVSARKRSGGSRANMRNWRASSIWLRTISAGLAPVCVTPPKANLSRFSFYSATGPLKPLNDTSVRGRGWFRRSTITSESNRRQVKMLPLTRTRSRSIMGVTN